MNKKFKRIVLKIYKRSPTKTLTSSLLTPSASPKYELTTFRKNTGKSSFHLRTTSATKYSFLRVGTYEVPFVRLCRSVGDLPSVAPCKKVEVETLKCKVDALQKKVEELERICNKEETDKYNKLKEWGKERVEWTKEKRLLLDINQKYIKTLEQLITGINNLHE